MRHTAFAVLLLGLIGLVASAGEPVRLRVLCYNIHHAEGVDRRLDVERIARVIASVKPDIVALQEVDRRAKRTQSVDQPSELARLTDLHVVFGANIPLPGGSYGNALLSRFPIARHENHLLPNPEGGEQRGLLEAEVAVGSGNQRLLVLVTHLDFEASGRQRLASASVINALVAERAEQPALLAGDLNDTPGSQTLKELASMWRPVNAKPMPTVPVGRPTKQIDFILYRPPDRWRVVQVDVLDEVVASDHRAIFAILEWSPGNAR